MKFLLFLYFLISMELFSESYNFNWYPKENSNNNVVEMPNKDKFLCFCQMEFGKTV